MNTHLVYLPKSSPSHPHGLFAFIGGSHHHAGWGVGLDGPARAARAAELTRAFLAKWCDDDDDLVREVAAAAFRRGLYVVADYPEPDPDDESQAAVEAWRAWHDAIDAEIDRVEAASRCPCPPTMSDG